MLDSMPIPLIADIFEPPEIVVLLRQSLDAQVGELNVKGFADYLWNAVDGHSIQVERKQAGELLSSLDHVESQLRNQYDKCQENLLLIEGFVVPAPHGCYVLKPSKDSKLFFPEKDYKTGEFREYKVSYAGFLSWLYQLDKSGITVPYPTPNMAGTASLLSALYWNSQKAEHTTLRRYIKQKIHLEGLNPFVETMMGIKGVALGEKKASALVERFGTPFNIFIQEEETLCSVEGIGKTLAGQLLRALGRPG